MNNPDVDRLLNNCADELTRIQTLIDSLGIMSTVVPYLTNYALIRACGTSEQACNSIIIDFCTRTSNAQVKNFLSQKVRVVPEYDRICQLLKEFDVAWRETFKSEVSSRSDKDQLKTSLKSLVDTRNSFAHGGNPTVSIGDVMRYFEHARQIIVVLDNVIR